MRVPDDVAHIYRTRHLFRIPETITDIVGDGVDTYGIGVHDIAADDNVFGEEIPGALVIDRDAWFRVGTAETEDNFRVALEGNHRREGIHDFYGALLLHIEVVLFEVDEVGNHVGTEGVFIHRDGRLDEVADIHACIGIPGRRTRINILCAAFVDDVGVSVQGNDGQLHVVQGQGCFGDARVSAGIRGGIDQPEYMLCRTAHVEVGGHRERHRVV